MKKLIKTILPISLLCASSITVAATPMSGPYMRGFGGFAFTTSNTVNINNFNNTSYKSGYAFGGQIGYKSGPIRYEFEGTYTHNKLDSFSLAGVKQTNVSGSTHSGAVLLNLYYDFEDLNMALAPYIGVGFGYAVVKNILNSSAPTIAAFNQQDSLFAYKAQVGVNYNFSENIGTDLGYQYFSTKNSKTFNQRFQTHLVNMGITYRFDK